MNNLPMKFTQYTFGILLLNVTALIFASFYLWNGWHYRAFPFLNLVFFLEIAITFLILPCYFIWLNQLNIDKQDVRKFKIGAGFFLFFLLMSIYGGGMHNSANQIRAIADDPIIYFYDEILSHYILLSGMFGMAFSLALLSFNSPHSNSKDNSNPSSISKLEKSIIIISGTFQGLILSIASMEAHFGFGALILTLVFNVILIIKLWRKSFYKFPLAYYYLTYFLIIFLFLSVFLLINHGFVEPSQVRR